MTPPTFDELRESPQPCPCKRLSVTGARHPLHPATLEYARKVAVPYAGSEDRTMTDEQGRQA